MVLGGFSEGIDIEIDDPAAGHVAGIGVSLEKHLAVAVGVAVAVKGCRSLVQELHKCRRAVIEPGVVGDPGIRDRMMTEHQGQIGVGMTLELCVDKVQFIIYLLQRKIKIKPLRVTTTGFGLNYILRRAKIISRDASMPESVLLKNNRK